LALLAIATTILTVAPSGAQASSLSDQLRTSRRELRRAEVRLEAADAALASAILARQNRGLGPLILEVQKREYAVRFWKGVIKQLLAKQAKLAAVTQAASSGDWKTLIRRAAKKYGVDADGLYRLMMMESGGKARAVGAGRYYGLYQYALVTWKDDWNPWRGKSVYDGAAQIEASAYAIKKGMGRSLWGNTYPAAF
jgi:soluble lytic murein transglycosylase-like protein